MLYIAINRVAVSALLTGAASLFAINLCWAGIPIEHWTQPNGAQVYLVPSPSIPMVDVQIDFDAGSRRDAPRQAGLANLTAQSTSYGVRGGAGLSALDENRLSEAWADLGASFGGSAGGDRMSFNLRTLSYPDLLAQAKSKIAFGPQTWPHALARAMLTEQVYRAVTILAGSPYHRD